MLVKFADKERPQIILERQYDNISPLLEMVKQKSTLSIFMDPNGKQTVHGRFYDYEYTLSSNSPDDEWKEYLMVYFESNFNSITGPEKYIKMKNENL